MNWRKLTSESEFDEILMQSLSEGSAFLLFKHSTRCMVSTMAKRSFEAEYAGDYPTYFVDLVKFRALSNHIASVTKVTHQSPQLISVKSGKVTYHESHHKICAKDSVCEF